MKKINCKILLVLCVSQLVCLVGCKKEKLFVEDYCICIVNDTTDRISINVLSGWEQELEPYQHTGGLSLIYYIPKTEKITWVRNGKQYADTIPIKDLLAGYIKDSGEVSYIIKNDNAIVVKYEVEGQEYFLIDKPEYAKSREENILLFEAIENDNIKRGCKINCVNGHRFVNLLLKGIYYGQTDTRRKTQTGTH